MTYIFWEEELLKRGISIRSVRLAIGVTPQAIYKWRVSNKVGKLGEFYLKTLKADVDSSKTCEEILKERGSDYGSFDSNIEGIAKYKPGLVVDYKVKAGSEILVETAIDYVGYMLALKTVRSQSPSIRKASFIDCINDFINYYNLLEDLLKEHCNNYTIELQKPYKLAKIDSNSKETLLSEGI